MCLGMLQVAPWTDAAASFVPMVLNSVTDSMQRSAAFGPVLRASQSKLSSSSAAKTMFHSTVG